MDHQRLGTTTFLKHISVEKKGLQVAKLKAQKLAAGGTISQQ